MAFPLMQVSGEREREKGEGGDLSFSSYKSTNFIMRA